MWKVRGSIGNVHFRTSSGIFCVKCQKFIFAVGRHCFLCSHNCTEDVSVFRHGIDSNQLLEDDCAMVYDYIANGRWEPFPEEQNPVHSSEVLSMKQKVEKIAAAVFNLFREKIGKSTSIGFSFKLHQGHFVTTHDPFTTHD